MEAARRQAIYNARVSATTEQFYRRYMEQYDQMNVKGFAAYIPSEMNRLKSDLAQIRELLVSNPTEARDLSFEVGSYIRSMYSLASTAAEQFERAERMRSERMKAERMEQQNKLMQLYFEMLRTISNPIVVNFSVGDMQKLRQDIESGNVHSQVEVKKNVQSIIAKAEIKSEEWKKNTVIENKKKDIESVLDETEQRVKNEKIENSEKTAEFINKIKKLRSDIDSGISDLSAIKSKLSKIETEIDDTLIMEEVRRETVKAIIKQLRSQEFTVEKPQIVQNDGKSYVKIVAQRPSGKRAMCNIDLHGKIAYKFDNYEGMTCLKDIEKFNIDLEEIYSVKLSDERVLWSNPDKLSMDAELIPKNNGRNA